MPRLFPVSLRLACAFIAVVLTCGLQSDSHRNAGSGRFGAVPAFAATAPRPGARDHVASRARLSSSYAKLPISFEPNHGQTAGVVQYLAHGAGYTLFLLPGEMLLSLHASAPKPLSAPLSSKIKPPSVPARETSAVVRMQLIGSNQHALALGIDPLAGKSNYLTGSDPAQWHTDISTYAKVRYSGLYPGIDLVYYGNQEGKLEHDFVVAPGADPQRIEFSVRDENHTASLRAGELTLHTRAGNLTLPPPVAYQVIDGERRPVAVTYQSAGSGCIAFRLGLYDKHLPLVIDPILVYSSVFGGSGPDWVESVAIDTARNVYVTGFTFSGNFPLANPYQSTPAVAFVSKLNPSGTALVYSTYLGGNQTYGMAIAVDASGRAYLSGTTGPGFPVVNAYQPTNGGYTDAFITVLKPAGNALEWSTYLGGPSDDSGSALALDPAGNVYVTGFSNYSFPQLHGIPGAHCAGDVSICIWAAKFNKAGALQYSTIFGAGIGVAITADSNGSAYITGLGFGGGDTPTTPGAFQSGCPGGGCPFVAKFSPAGDSLLYSTTLGSISGRGEAIAVDSGGSAYVAGSAGPGLPVWSTGFQRTFGGGSTDGFVAKLNATGTNLTWSTYLGGSGDDVIQGLALDQYRQVYVSGYTTSPDFPLKSPIQYYNGTNSAPYQFFVTTLSGSLSSIPYYSTYFGSATPGDFGSGTFPAGAKIAVDPALNVYLACVDRANVLPTPGSYATGLSGISISKLVIMDDLALTMKADQQSVSPGQAVNYVISVTSNGPDSAVNVHISDMLPADTILVSDYCGGAPFSGTGPNPGCTLPKLDKGATWSVTFVVIVLAPAGTTLSNTATVTSNMQDFVTSNNTAVIKTPVN